MASIEDYHFATNLAPSTRPQQHERSKSASVLKSFIHRRNNSDGTTLPPADLSVPPSPTFQSTPQQQMGFPNFSRPAALGEIQQNQVGSPSRSPVKQQERPTAPSSPTKNLFLKSAAARSTDKLAKHAKQNEPASESIPKKIKSTTNLVGLLSRPKSSKNLHNMASEDGLRPKKDKENRTPPSSLTPPEMTRPPIYAEFSSGAVEKEARRDNRKDVFTSASPGNNLLSVPSSGPKMKERPKSYHVCYTAKADSDQAAGILSGSGSTKGSPSKIQRGLKLFTGGTGPKQRPASVAVAELVLDPKDIDKHLEAMLDRRNIPVHQRHKMRNLADTIKMEFIRQDWAESRGLNNTRPDSHDSDSSMTGIQDAGDAKAKKTRGRSFTLSRSNRKKSESRSPSKKQKGEGTLGRHFRSRSTDSVASDRPSSVGSSSGGGLLSKMKPQHGPSDFVNYLRKVQEPEQVEVGKLHKLRLLLRNETVAWTEEFIRQGGMQEIVGLLHRIMEVEWREEHEDALLHENLLCLKALCTTALALQYLHSTQATLFPALLHMLFDPEKKGPSEFTTRNIITSVLFTYIQSASPQDRYVRVRTVLGHLRDPEPKDDQRPVDFVLGMRRERPYRVWCKEAVGVTKEVFWIFLHHLNVVYLPREKEPKGEPGLSSTDSMTYMQTHFPQERPPVPAAPYVGGVEWDATNYLASHLDLLNAIVACTPTAEERNQLRGLFQISGWERCMGGSLRLCKEKFYPGVHDALRTWVAAAAEDGWDVRDVRYGPRAEPRSPAKKQAGGGGGNRGKKKDEEAPPRIEIPKLDFGLDGASGAATPTSAKANENWVL
ncbi:armadillo-type protein [Xylariaceae sp. FL0662B]|nr:armadillo-type protein [Xylariaceae sp. FL0662B]